MNEIDHYLTSEIVCPHCGYQYEDSWELHDDDGATLDCSNCDSPFTLEVNYDVSYITEKA